MDIHTKSSSTPLQVVYLTTVAIFSMFWLLSINKAFTIPRLFPSREVFWELRPAKAPTQHREAAKYAIWCISGKPAVAAYPYPPRNAAAGRAYR